MLSKDYLMLRSATCPEEPPQAASRRGARLEARTVLLQRLFDQRGLFPDSRESGIRGLRVLRLSWTPAFSGVTGNVFI
jgi:hypothetical protein